MFFTTWSKESVDRNPIIPNVAVHKLVLTKVQSSIFIYLFNLKSQIDNHKI